MKPEAKFQRLADADRKAQDLRVSIRRCGPHDHRTKALAVEWCHLAGMIPHFKYPLYPNFTTAMVPEPTLSTPLYEEEWQRVIQRHTDKL